jgi:hypothetical protein
LLRATPGFSRYEPINGRCHLVYAEDAENIVLEGRGRIDGNVDGFLEKRENGGYIKSADRLQPMIRFLNCTGVEVYDLRIENSPGWTLHPMCCERVRITGVTILNSLFVPNSDGIDIEGCRDTIISSCNIFTGDDAIVVKAGKQSKSCEQIVVDKCVIRTRCAAVGIGSEAHWPIRDVSFTNCTIPMANRLMKISVKQRSLVENVVLSCITGSTLNNMAPERLLHIDVQQPRGEPGNLGAVRNVIIENVAAVTRGRILFTAQDGATIEGLTLSNIHITVPEIEDAQVAVPESSSIQLSNHSPETRAARGLLVLDNCRKVMVKNVQVTWPGESDDVAEKRLDSDYVRLRDALIEETVTRGERASRDDVMARYSKTLPMHALVLRKSTEVVIDSPFLVPHEGASRVDTVGD